MATKQQKELEAKLHAQVYNNIYLLTLTHPPSGDFTKVFKKDMFVKNNKEGFHQVIHYLLNVLDPIRFKEKVITWPILDIRSESQFRKEVMKYINELNSLYEDANIPTVMTSHLITPGGYKFAKFLLKLSQLVMYEQLRKDPEISNDMIHRIVPNKSSERTQHIITRLRQKTQFINKTVRSLIMHFEKDLETCRNKATSIVHKQNHLNMDLPVLEGKRDILAREVQHDDVFASDKITADLELVRDGINYVNKFDEKLKYLCDKVDLLSSGNLHLGCDSPKELNLLQLFDEFNQMLGRKCSKITVLNTSDLSKNIEMFSAINEKLQKLTDSLIGIQDELIVSSQSLKQQEVDFPANTILKSILENELDSTILAVPLEDTPMK